MNYVKQYPNRAPCLIGISSALVMSACIILIKFHSEIGPNEFVFKRGLIMFLLNLFAVKSQKLSVYIEDKKAFWLVIQRSLWFIACIVFWMYALHMISAGVTTVLEQTNAIWTIIMMRMMYGDPISKTDIYLILISLFGIVLIIDPALLDFSSGETTADGEEGQGENGINYTQIIGCFFALMDAVTFAYGASLTRKLKGSVRNEIANQHQNFLAVVVGASAIILSGEQIKIGFQLSDIKFYLDLFIVAFFSWIYQFLTGFGFMHSQPAKILPFLYLEIAICYICDVVIFGVTISYVSLFGSAIVVGCCFVFAIK